MLHNWVLFVESHTKIVLGAGLLIVAFVLVNKWETHRHDEAIAAAATTQQALNEQIKKNADLAAQVSASTQAYTQLAAQMAKANAALKAEIASLNQKLAEQQQTDANMTLSELADRWAGLIGMDGPDIIAQGKDTMSVSGQAAHKTVEQLEMVEPLHKEVLDGHAIEDNLNKQITGLNGVNTAQAAQITGLQTQLVKADDACQAKLKVVKPTFFGKVKSALKSFGIGVGVGVALSHKF